MMQSSTLNSQFHSLRFRKSYKFKFFNFYSIQKLLLHRILTPINNNRYKNRKIPNLADFDNEKIMPFLVTSKNPRKQIRKNLKLPFNLNKRIAN